MRMTRTVTRPSSGEISGAFSALRVGWSSMPRKPSPSQIRFPDSRPRAVIGRGRAARAPRRSSRIADDETRAAQSDATDLPSQTPRRRFSDLVYREPDARRAAVNRQDAKARDPRSCHRLIAASIPDETAERRPRNVCVVVNTFRSAYGHPTVTLAQLATFTWLSVPGTRSMLPSMATMSLSLSPQSDRLPVHVDGVLMRVLGAPVRGLVRPASLESRHLSNEC